MNIRILSAVAGAACTLALLVPGMAQSALVARDLDGITSTAEAYYDSARGITWMRDRNHLSTSLGLLPSTGFMTWADGDAAITALNANAAASFGLSGWRMPTANGVHSIGGAGCQFGFNGNTDCGSNVDTGSSELAHLFHDILGNLSDRDSSGNWRAGSAGIDFGLVNDEDFLNVETGRYWSSTQSYRMIFNTPQTGYVTFDFANGGQSITAANASNRGYVWLVHDGDVGGAVSQAVPEPATLLLAGLALCAMGAGRWRDRVSLR